MRYYGLKVLYMVVASFHPTGKGENYFMAEVPYQNNLLDGVFKELGNFVLKQQNQIQNQQRQDDWRGQDQSQRFHFVFIYWYIRFQIDCIHDVIFIAVF